MTGDDNKLIETGCTVDCISLSTYEFAWKQAFNTNFMRFPTSRGWFLLPFMNDFSSGKYFFDAAFSLHAIFKKCTIEGHVVT